jgi:hypothetical protein
LARVDRWSTNAKGVMVGVGLGMASFKVGELGMVCREEG